MRRPLLLALAMCSIAMPEGDAFPAISLPPPAPPPPRPPQDPKFYEAEFRSPMIAAPRRMKLADLERRSRKNARRKRRR